MTLLYIHRAPSALYFGRPTGNAEAQMPRVVEFERVLVA